MTIIRFCSPKHKIQILINSNLANSLIQMNHNIISHYILIKKPSFIINLIIQVLFFNNIYQMRNKISFSSTKKSNQGNKNQNVADYQLNTKLTLPKLNQNRKVGSLPSYTNIHSGGDSISKSKHYQQNGNFQENQIQFTKLRLEFPKISAKSYILYNKETGEIIKAQSQKVKRQIASLTKLMTAICSIQISNKYKLNLKETFFRITESSTDINGTLANLQSFQWISINDLLHGLMLPSGNDAANVLAQNLGAIMYFDKIGQHQMIQELKSIDLTQDGINIATYINEFIMYMNETARKLELKNTRFGNPHGLDHRNNYSSCEDIVKLSLYCIQNDYFNKIVNCKNYRAQVRIYKNKVLYKKSIYWCNTNKLLGKIGCKGIKTGYTPQAGGCLTSLFQVKSNSKETNLILIVVLGSRSQQQRFSDTQSLIQWYMSEDICEQQKRMQ